MSATIAKCFPLSPQKWGLIPLVPIPGLGRVLPAALAASPTVAREVVRRLPPADFDRLRTAALCMARMQRCTEQRREQCWPQYLPRGVVEHILSLFYDA